MPQCYSMSCIGYKMIDRCPKANENSGNALYTVACTQLFTPLIIHLKNYSVLIGLKGGNTSVNLRH